MGPRSIPKCHGKRQNFKAAAATAGRSVHSLRARSHCDGNGIIFIILLSNVDVTDGYYGTQLRCSHGNGIFKNQNRRCRHSVNQL